MTETSSANVWRGVLIEEGLTDKTVLSHITILRANKERLEGQEELGEFHFHKVEVDDAVLDMVLKLAAESLKSDWYFHLVKGDTMKVVFHGRIFEALRGNSEQFRTIQDYAASLGIPSEQIELGRLLDNPFDE